MSTRAVETSIHARSPLLGVGAGAAAGAAADAAAAGAPAGAAGAAAGAALASAGAVAAGGGGGPGFFFSRHAAPREGGRGPRRGRGKEGFICGFPLYGR